MFHTNIAALSLQNAHPTICSRPTTSGLQREDEVKKHAPGLIVKTFHSSRKKKNKEAVDLRDRQEILSLNNIDVIISTSTFAWPSYSEYSRHYVLIELARTFIALIVSYFLFATVTESCVFHRVIQDESHLFDSPSAKTDHANKIIAPRRWGVTATPMTNSSRELSNQLKFIQGSEPYNIFSPLKQAIYAYVQTENTFNHLVELLQTFMVRHTKSQRINGSEALSLPPSTTSTIMLKMTPDENRAFNKIHSPQAIFLRHRSGGVNRFTAEKHFLPVRLS